MPVTYNRKAAKSFSLAFLIHSIDGI